MKFASLGSGSEGNALLVAASDASATIMVDCGFALRETERRLRRIGVEPGAISAIFVTHEHSDHVGGVFKLARKYRIPVFLSQGTWQAARADADGVELSWCRDSAPIEIGSLRLLPYTVPHDAREPLQCVVQEGVQRLGVLTDAGHATEHMIAMLDACDALLLEYNHDPRMLMESSYPHFLKQRIAGDHGHLSNQASADILAAIDRSRLKTVVAAHLSRKNNTPELAMAAMLSVIAEGSVALSCACQDMGFGWIEV
ncbi:MAG TPA: MBL fold metallo-hydrolase [Burkholderiaceae bacterium]